MEQFDLVSVKYFYLFNSSSNYCLISFFWYCELQIILAFFFVFVFYNLKHSISVSKPSLYYDNFTSINNTIISSEDSNTILFNSIYSNSLIPLVIKSCYYLKIIVSFYNSYLLSQNIFSFKETICSAIIIFIIKFVFFCIKSNGIYFYTLYNYYLL